VKKTVEERFWEKVDTSGACWLWLGARKGGKTGQEYGDFYYQGAKVTAHRASLLLTGVIIPLGKVVCHICNVKRCVRPSHLYVGTSSQNSYDAVKAGTHPQAKKLFCKFGHEYTDENTYWSNTRTGWGRWCRECHRVASNKAYYTKKDLTK